MEGAARRAASGHRHLQRLTTSIRSYTGGGTDTVNYAHDAMLVMMYHFWYFFRHAQGKTNRSLFLSPGFGQGAGARVVEKHAAR